MAVVNLLSVMFMVWRDPLGSLRRRTCCRLVHRFCFPNVLAILSGKKKAHKHKVFGPFALGTPRECPRDKPGLSPGQSARFSSYFTQLVPVWPWDIPGTKGGRQSLCVKSLCAFFVPYSQAPAACSWSLEFLVRKRFRQQKVSILSRVHTKGVMQQHASQKGSYKVL